MISRDTKQGKSKNLGSFIGALRTLMFQSAGAVGYTDCNYTDGLKSLNETPVNDT